MDRDISRYNDGDQRESNVFVLIAQFFMKIPALKTLAPTQSEPPFLGTQVAVMVVFFVLGVLAAKRFPGEAVHAA